MLMLLPQPAQPAQPGGCGDAAGDASTHDASASQYLSVKRRISATCRSLHFCAEQPPDSGLRVREAGVKGGREVGE